MPNILQPLSLIHVSLWLYTFSLIVYGCTFSLWIQLQARHSQVAYECVPLLLHCLTLPTGADMLWKIVEENFSSDDWKERFAAGTL